MLLVHNLGKHLFIDTYDTFESKMNEHKNCAQFSKFLEITHTRDAIVIHNTAFRINNDQHRFVFHEVCFFFHPFHICASSKRNYSFWAFAFAVALPFINYIIIIFSMKRSNDWQSSTHFTIFAFVNGFPLRSVVHSTHTHTHTPTQKTFIYFHSALKLQLQTLSLSIVS